MEQEEIQQLRNQPLVVKITNQESSEEVVFESADNNNEHQIESGEVAHGGDGSGKTSSSVVPQTFAKVEKSLASLGFFTPSSRRIKDQKMKRIGFTREIDGKRVEVSAEIHPSGAFGLPVTADQDKYLALQKIITNTLHSEGKIENPIRFKSAELLRMLNSSRKSGKNYKDVSEWLDVMSGTMIISDGAVYVAGQKRFARDRFRVFDRAVSVGKELDDGSVADANYIWLSQWQLDNINKNFLLPVDLDTYRELKNHIAKALVPLLQIWLYATHKAGSFEKRYDELCEILTLQTYRAPSLIRRQLKPSLDELVQYEYLEKWQIEKTSDKKSYKVIFCHGAKFYRDRRRRLEQKTLKETPVIIAQSEPVEPILPQPGKLETPKLNTTTLHHLQSIDSNNTEEKLVDELAGRGLMPSVALKLLRSLPSDQLDGVPDYVEYWDALKRVKQVTEGLLYDLIRNGDPLSASFEPARKRAARQAGELRKANLERLEKALEAKYEEHRRQAFERAVAEVSTEEFENRVQEHKRKILETGDYWSERPEMAEQFARHEVQAQIAKSTAIERYQHFRSRALPGVISDLQLDPEELGIDLSENETKIDIPPNALYAPPSNDQSQSAGSPISEQNSSPEAV